METASPWPTRWAMQPIASRLETSASSRCTLGPTRPGWGRLMHGRFPQAISRSDAGHQARVECAPYRLLFGESVRRCPSLLALLQTVSRRGGDTGIITYKLPKSNKILAPRTVQKPPQTLFTQIAKARSKHDSDFTDPSGVDYWDGFEKSWSR